MNWSDLHQRSEMLATEAQAALRDDPERARELFTDAAKLEAQALDEIEPTKLRTIGITAVSAVALWFKAQRFEEARELADQVLASESLPAFAVRQLAALLQAITNRHGRKEKSNAGYGLH